MNKKLLALFVLVLACTLLIVGCGKKDAKQVMADGIKKSSEMKNADFDMNMAMKMTINGNTLEIPMTVKGTLFSNPLKLKMDTELPISPDKKIPATFYIAQDNNKELTMYINAENQWFKQKVEDEATIKAMTMDPSENIKMFMDNLKSAEVKGEEKIGEKTATIIDLVAGGDIYNKLMGQSNPQSNRNQLPQEYLKNLGDLHYTLWVTDEGIVKGQMDLTKNFKNLVEAILADSNASKQAKAQAEAFKNMEMRIEFVYSNINKAANFDIPQEALNARQANR